MKIRNWCCVNWSGKLTDNHIKPLNMVNCKIKGNVFGNPKFEDGTKIYTGRVQSLKNGIIKTEFGDYKLENPLKIYSSKFPESLEVSQWEN